jgi:hypothetical protein
MSKEPRSVSEISHQAIRVLFDKMGVVDTIRFLNQFSMGLGDYTCDREQWLGDISLNEALAQIKGIDKH